MKRIIILILLCFLGNEFSRQQPDWFSNWKPYGTIRNLNRIKNYVPNNPVIVEAGARFGEDTLLMQKCWPNSTAYCFEPVPESFKKLENATIGYENIHCFPYALTNKVGWADLWICNGNIGASSLHNYLSNSHIATHGWTIEKEPIKVQCTTLDYWAKQENITHVDFMWLDMEGEELSMIKASPRIISTVQAIWMEVYLVHVRENVPLYKEVRGYMESIGFNVAFEVGKARQKDVLFVRPLPKTDPKKSKGL